MIAHAGQVAVADLPALRTLLVEHLLADPERKAKRERGLVTFRCPLPAHDDDTPSAMLGDYGWKCFCGRQGNGRLVELAAALGLDVRLGTARGYTVDDYAVEKGLPVHKLEEWGLTTEPGKFGSPVVYVPYYGPDGALLRRRLRLPKRQGKKNQYWEGEGGSIPGLYGLWMLPRVAPDAPVLLVEGECLTGDAEVLTPGGWVRLDAYDGQDVAQWDTDGSLDFVRPMRYVRKSYSGPMHRFANNQRFFAQVTPNHKMVSLDGKGHCRWTLAKDGPDSSAHRIPRVGLLNGRGTGRSWEEIQLALAISADAGIHEREDGCAYVHFNMGKERKLSRLRGLLRHFGISHTDNPAKKPGMRYISFRLPAHLAWMGKRLLPWEWVALATLAERRAILEELVEWDGNRVPNRNQIEYGTIHRENAEWVQALAHTAGFVSTIMERSNALGRWFKVSALYGKSTTSWQSLPRTGEQVPYEGEVFCVTVPTGMFLVRQNGCVSVTGNSDCHACWTAGILALGLPGADTWGHCRWAMELLRGRQVYVWMEPDEGGAVMHRAIAADLKDAKVIRAEDAGAKDPCALRQKDPNAFKKAMLALMEQAERIGTPKPPFVFDVVTPELLARIGAEKTEPLDVVPTPFPLWSDACRGKGGRQGHARGWHVIVGGKQGGMKSILKDNYTASALLGGERVCMVSLEMDQAENITRLLSIVSGVHPTELEHGEKYNLESWERASRVLHQIREDRGGELFINREEISCLDDIAESMLYYHEYHGCRTFLIDYLQLAWVRHAKNREDQITEVSHRVRALTKAHRWTTLSLSQITREAAKLKETPIPSNLFGGSALESDAVQVCFMDHSRVRKAQETVSLHGKRVPYETGSIDTVFHIAKNRVGPSLVDVPVRMNTATLRIEQREVREGEKW